MSTKKILLPFLLSCIILMNKGIAQRGFGSNSTASCGTDVLMNDYFQKNHAANNLNRQIELQLKNFRKLHQRPANPLATVVLPVVVHIIHTNGAENISDARVLAGIQHLNEAFKNSGYYDPATGVNTNIQFCLVKRDPAGMATTGITRSVSPYSNMSGAAYYSDDQNVKNIIRWNPLCYINIWLVNSIPGSVAAYAYLPAAHGADVDGIIAEASYFGASNSDDVVITHEMGHYLGLYHTFEQGCNNNDCTTDGDKVCDTPPDNSTSYTSCGVTVNSCSTDALSGFAKDMDDLATDYMDYGNWDCMSVFTQGQADRMNWFIQNVRNSLLNCNSCQPPCPAPVQANFSSSAASGAPGTTISFSNTSVNGAVYNWYVNDSMVSNALNYSFTFTQAGVYVIKLIAASSDPTLCIDNKKTDTIVISCPVKSAFTPGYNGVAAIGQNLSFINNSTGAVSYEWYRDNVLASNVQDYSTSFGTAGIHYIKLKAFSGSCVDSVTVYYVVNEGVTANNSYRKNYQLITGEAANFNCKFNLILPDQNILSIGGQDDNSSTSTVAKLTPAGEVIWAKAFKVRNPYPNTEKANINKAIFTKDGGILLLGHIDQNATNGLLLIKIDIDGNMLWHKFISYGSYDVSDGDITELPDGSFIVSGKFYYTMVSFHKFDVNGNRVWDKVLTSDVECFTHSLTSVGNEVYFSGFMEMRPSRFGNNEGGLIMKIDPSDGKVIFGNRYSYNNSRVWLGKIGHTGNRLIAEGTIVSAPLAPYSTPCLLTTDFAGNNNQLKLMDSSDTYFYGIYYDLLVDAKNNTLLSLNHQFSGQSRLLLFDSTLSFTNGKSWLFNNPVVSKSIAQFANGDYLVGNSYIGYNVGNIGTRLLPDLTVTTCPNENFATGVRNDTCTVTDITNSLTYLNSFTSAEKTLDILAEDRQIAVTPVCPIIDPPACDSAICREFHLEAPAQLCSVQDTVIVNIQKSSGCNLTTTWTIGDNVKYTSILQSDTLLKLAIDSTIAGNLFVKATSMSACRVFEDSVAINITSSPQKIDLGQDIQLCNESTIPLHAGPGFKTYLWQDGSIDSTFTAYLPGTYHVTATNFCGTVYSDTINISVAPVVPFDLGADRILCMNDTLLLTAPAGFSDYKWSPNYRINTAYGPSVQLFPEKDTIYTVTATKAFGCTVLDSIRIKLLPEPSINLGNDTAFCLGQALQLNAGNGFVSYQWNTNATTAFLTVTNPGNYWLRVSNAAGCYNTDSIHINIIDTPKLFVNPLYKTCEDKREYIKPSANFDAYLWYDGSTADSILIAQPGNYWLSVSNSQGCTAKESFTVAIVSCINAVYFPNAFSPNDDNRNETFKPFVSGQVKEYRLFVYNRFGEMVFETSDFSKGWDGRFKQKRQALGAYVWVCMYKLGNGISKKEKGTVLLIR